MRLNLCIVSKEEDKQHKLARVWKSLAICGYKDWVWDTATRNKAGNDQRLPRSKGNVGIPYVEDIMESLQRLFRSHGVKAFVHTQNTLRSLLVAPKDKAGKLEKCGAGYQDSFEVCPSTYVGENTPSKLAWMNTLDFPRQSANIWPIDSMTLIWTIWRSRTKIAICSGEVLTLKWSSYWALLLVVKGGSLWTLTQKTHFPKDFLTKLGICHCISRLL